LAIRFLGPDVRFTPESCRDSCRPVRPLWARSGHRQGLWRDAVLRSGALQRRTLHSLIVLTTLDSGRVLLLVEYLSCALTMSSYFGSVVIESFGTMCTIL